MFPKDIRQQLLKKFPEKLVNNAKLIELDKQEYLFHPTDPVESIYYVVKGQLRALRYQYDGKAAVMMHSTLNHFFAPVSINMARYPCAAMAHKKTQLLQIPKVTLVQLLHDDPDFSFLFITEISNDLRKQCSNAERLRIKSAKNRIIHFISCETTDSRTLHLQHPLTTWADELGLEPESLYRTLAEMEKEGLIKRDKRQIKILL